MNKMKKTVLALLIALSLCGCTSVQQASDPETSPAVTPNTTQAGESAAPERKIEISGDTSKYDAMTKYEDCVTDITGSGEDEIALLTSAEKDPEGEFMWDDSQDWALTVKNGSGVYVLYDENTRGTPALNVSEYYDDGSTVIRLTLSSSSGFEIREYRYSDNAFSEKVAYSTGAINELSINKY